MLKIALFGGTFNPFHVGHFKMLEAVNCLEDIDKIFVIPDKIPPHKEANFLANDKIRQEMCQIAISNFEKAELCLVEFEREGKSYTFDTVSLLKERYPDANFYFVLGGDMLVYFPKWYKSDELMKMMDFIAFRRSDIDNTEFDKSVQAFRNKGMKITVLDNEIPNVSSTEIRENFSSSKELLPEKIYEYLMERGVYGG